MNYKTHKLLIPKQDHGGQGHLATFVHANGYPPSCYEPLLNQLKDQIRIISILQRPLWNESDPEKIKDWHIFSYDLISFLDQQNIESTILIGHSLGALVSLRTAIMFPARVNALVVIDPVLFPPAIISLYGLIKSESLLYRFHPLIRTALKRRVTFDDDSQIFSNFRTKKIFKNLDDISLKAYILGITKKNNQDKIVLKYSPEWEARIYATAIWNDMDIWNGIKSIQCPMLFIRGEGSNSFPIAAIRKLRKINPGLNLATIKNATHLVPLEYPQMVGSIINKFIEENV